MTKRYGNNLVVDCPDIAAEEGEFLTLLGPSGCGKTTTLRMIAGFTKPDSGHILINGEPIEGKPPYKRNIGMVFQNYALFPHMTVAENLSYGLEMRKLDKNGIRRSVKEALQLVRLEGMEERFPRQLSGGQQQRIALARALVIHPVLLLLDEPLSNLDFKLRQAMRLEIPAIQQRLGITALYVTHDQTEALVMSTRLAVMNQGKIVQVGTPAEVYDHPETSFVADFMGEANILQGEILKVDVGRVVVGTNRDHRFTTHASSEHLAKSEELKQGMPVRVSIRPEKITLSDKPSGAENAYSGTIERVVYEGSDVRYHVRLQDGPLISVTKQIDQTRRIYRQDEHVCVEWLTVDGTLLTS